MKSNKKSLFGKIFARFRLFFKGDESYESLLDISISFEKLLNISNKRLFELQVQKEKETRINRRLLKFVSKKNAEIIMVNDQDPEIKTKKQVKTLYFSDIRNFTQISEILGDDLGPFLASYYKKIAGPIIDMEGEIHSYIGDAIFATFDDSYHAVLAAIDSRYKLNSFNRKRLSFTYSGKDKIELVTNGVGIATGESYIGNIGFEKKMSDTVIGRYVNMASRLEKLTKDYKVPILVGENTLTGIPEKNLFSNNLDYNSIDDIKGLFSLIKENIIKRNIFAREVGTVVPKGLQKKVRVYEIMNSYSNPMIALKSIFLKKYQNILHNEFNCPNAKTIKEQFQSLTEARQNFKELQGQFQTDFFIIENGNRKLNNLPSLTDKDRKKLSDINADKDFIINHKIQVVDKILKMMHAHPAHFEKDPWQGIESFNTNQQMF
ncbi:MAG: adenylate/guanylate cyclase domain-containing protein [Desulfobacterales bacterium]|nr:adenylate/guanylate cyclase domain-containing protein [Desulfobacterales bacterium]